MSMLLIRGGRVFDGERLRPEPALDVLVRGDRIESVAPGDGRVVLDRTGGKDR